MNDCLRNKKDFLNQLKQKSNLPMIIYVATVDVKVLHTNLHYKDIEISPITLEIGQRCSIVSLEETNYPEPRQTSIMESFAAIINGF